MVGVFVKTKEKISYLVKQKIKIDEDKLKENGLEALPLVQSSTKSWVLHDPSKDVSMIRPPASEADFDGPQTLALLITGKFPFYYADRPIPEWPKEENEEGEGFISIIRKLFCKIFHPISDEKYGKCVG